MRDYGGGGSVLLPFKLYAAFPIFHIFNMIYFTYALVCYSTCKHVPEAPI